jgi:hypothetical protein
MHTKRRAKRLLILPAIAASLLVGLSTAAVASARPHPVKAHAALHSLDWAFQQACAANAASGNYLTSVYIGPPSGCGASRGGWDASVNRFDVYVYYWSLGNGCNNHPWWAVAIHALVSDGGSVADQGGFYFYMC